MRLSHLWTVYFLSLSVVLMSCGESSTKTAEPLVPLVVVESQTDDTAGEEQENFNLNSDAPVMIKNLNQIVSSSFSQSIELSPDDENFKEKVTTFLQSDETPPMVDILIVVDNSGSMGEEQANLAPKLSALLEHIKNIDWQINVISTDSACPEQSYLPLNSQMDPKEVEDKFAEAIISLGTSGSADERGILMAASNLLGIKNGTCSQAPAQWLRDKSKIAIIFVTDENEAPFRDFLANKDVLFEVFKEIDRKPNSEARIYGLLNLGAASKKCAIEVQQSVLHQEAIFATGGFFGNICASDYSSVLGEISQDVSYLTSLRIKLSGEPVASTINVTLADSTSMPGGASLGGGGLFLDWLIIGDMLVLSKPLEPGSLITIKYKTRQARFIKLDQKVEDNAKFQVYFDNKEVSSGAYRFLSKENGLYFKEDLPLGVNIVIKISRPTALIEHFDFPKVKSSIECFDEQNQKLNHSYSYYTGKISFEKTLAEGSTAYCLYRQ